MYVLTGGHDRLINLYNTQTGSYVSTYTGHSWPVYDLSLSHTGNFLSAGGDRALFYWDAAAHRVLRKFTGHSQRLNAVTFGGSGDCVAISASYDRTVRVWDLKASGRFPIQILDEAQDSVSAVQVSGPMIITSSVDGHVRQYDIRTGHLLVDNVQEPVTNVCYTQDRLAYLATCLDSRQRLFDSATGVLLNEYEGHQNNQYRIKSSFFHNDALVVGGSETGEIFFWNLVTARIVRRLSAAHKQSITTVVTHKGQKLLTTSLDGTSIIWS